MKQLIGVASDRWGGAVRFFHWTVAALVLVQLPLGWAAVAWRMSPLKLDLFVWHKSIGLVVLVTMVMRLLWRIVDARRPPPRGPAWSRRAASTVHAALYGVLFALPLSGWIINSAANVPFRIFRVVPLPAIVAPDKALADAASRAHLLLLVVLVALLAVHVGAALWHQRVRRDDVLARMLPTRGSRR